MIVVSMSVTRQYIDGFRNMEKYFIKFGKRKTDSPSTYGKWMEPISKLKESGTICIERSMPMD
ncbi:hypothetical protein D928_01069 [Enterococcus faecalis 20-SD-BW-06]|nr:hypothetical protein D928_01069 [Enterococcus faecalis 20-SD-BW-06]EPI03162.1 hypothetical protein D919_00508 [Enterococcus faecalis 20-SD-BW-08]